MLFLKHFTFHELQNKKGKTWIVLRAAKRNLGLAVLQVVI